MRASCAALAAQARHVTIEVERIGSLEPAPPPVLDPERHFLEGSREEVARYLLCLDAINFGSGWFPTLRKRPGSSGYFTVAWSLADAFRSDGPWSNEELLALDGRRLARVMGQDPDHELMGLFAQGLRDLGSFLGEDDALATIARAEGSAERLAELLADGMPFFDDKGFYKRAQLTPSDLSLAGVAEFHDLDRLTIFADNLVPHVLRVDGVLRYAPELADRIDREGLLPAGPEEREIRACAVHACTLIARELGIDEQTLDHVLWQRGGQPEYKARPRHRTRTVFY